MPTLRYQEKRMVGKPWNKSKDAYYYWYKKVQTACVEAMELPDALQVPEFVPLAVPAEAVNEAKTAHSVTPPAVVSIHLDKARIHIPEKICRSTCIRN